MEEQLVKKAIKGNKKAFDKLINTYSHDAYRLAFYYLKHPADSQDALGTAIEKAYKAVHRLKQPEKFKTWLMTIVANEAKMILRQRAAMHVIPLDSMIDLLEDAHSRTENREDVLDLQKALNKLAEEDRTLLMMKHYEGYTFKELSVILETSESTVKTKHYSLLEKLRNDLETKEDRYVKQQ